MDQRLKWKMKQDKYQKKIGVNTFINWEWRKKKNFPAITQNLEEIQTDTLHYTTSFFKVCMAKA